MLLFNLFLNAIFSMVALYIFNRTNYSEENRTFFGTLLYYVYKISLVVITLVPITSCLIRIPFFFYIVNIALMNLVLISIHLISVRKPQI